MREGERKGGREEEGEREERENKGGGIYSTLALNVL